MAGRTVAGAAGIVRIEALNGAGRKGSSSRLSWISGRGWGGGGPAGSGLPSGGQTSADKGGEIENRRERWWWREEREGPRVEGEKSEILLSLGV